MTLPSPNIEPDAPEAGEPKPSVGDAHRFDRGVSPIAGPGSRRGRLIVLAAIVLGCGVFLAATWDRGESQERATPEAAAPPRELNPFEPARRDRPPLLSEATTDPEAPVLQPDEVVPPLEASSPPAPSSEPSPEAQRRVLAESARRAPVLAYTRTGGGHRPAPPTAETALPSDIEAPPNALDALRQSSAIDVRRAGRVPDRNLLLAAGAILPCVLQTAMDSTTPGQVSCILPRDVYSESGAVVLLERGTRVLGEYRGGLQQGRRRLFVLWTRAVSPTGVSIALNSPAADGLGRSGFDGAVDTRFWDRFGGALLLSLVDDGAYAAFGGGDDLRASARLPSDAASTALQGAVDIPPTLRKAQGSDVSIFVARDLDFRGVYRLRPRP